MTEQLMSVPAISKVPAGSVSGESRGAEVRLTLGEATGAERGGSVAGQGEGERDRKREDNRHAICCGGQEQS